MNKFSREKARQSIQIQLDSGKTQAERNKLGQFATPAILAREITEQCILIVDKARKIRFLDPAFGTGAFFSAILDMLPKHRLEMSKGFEIDASYGQPAREFWKDTLLDLDLSDFTQSAPPTNEKNRFNLIICNPPYVRHHHIAPGEKKRLQHSVERECGVRMDGLSGLYCYFLGLSHAWLQQGGIACWLVPSEFMSVNYGKSVKHYLLNAVTLIRIHRFDPVEVQFQDALVSSVVIWFRKTPPPPQHTVLFTFGGKISSPRISREVPSRLLHNETKWTRFPVSSTEKISHQFCLSDFFIIKRGIATGSNNFFILSQNDIEHRNLPKSFFRPILPSPRYLPNDEIFSDKHGLPLIDRKLFLLNCRLSEEDIKNRFPALWKYLENGLGTISEHYLCKSRKSWYFQDKRDPAPLLCTYMGRKNTKTGNPFRFILNHSDAIAANVYLLMYPHGALSHAIAANPGLLHRVWEILNNLAPDLLFQEGRVYGGGLYKLEPKELSNVNAAAIAELIPDHVKIPVKSIQLEFAEL